MTTIAATTSSPKSAAHGHGLPPSTTVAIRKSAVHGDALTALLATRPGELCFEEPMLFWVATTRLSGDPLTRADSMLSMQALDEDAVEQAIKESDMTKDHLLEFQAFSGSSNLHRFQISSYDMCSTWSELPVGFGYGRYGAYLNHSCRPNLIYFWDPLGEKMQLRALTGIAPGDELTIDYLATEKWLTANDRKIDLARLLKLDSCACEKCNSRDSEASDERIMGIRQLEETLAASVQTGATNPEALMLVQSYEKLLLQEFESSEQPEASRVDPRLVNAYRLASIVLDKAGHSGEATVRKAKADKMADMCFGKGNANITQQEFRFKQWLGQ